MSNISKSKAVTLASAVALTGSAAVIGNPFDCRNNNEVSLNFAYTKGGSATLVTIIIEGTQTKDTWTNAVEVPISLDFSGALSAGLATAPLGKMRYTIDTTGSYHLPVNVAGMHQIRVKALEGGTPGGTLGIIATGVQGAP